MNQLSKKTIVGLIIGIIILVSISFWLGMKKGETNSQLSSNLMGNTGMIRGGNGGMRGRSGNFAVGTIISSDSTSLTLSVPGGGSKIILISPSTTILKSAPGTPSDLTSGMNVMINGKPNADGSVSASTISLRPGESKSTQDAPVHN